MKRTGKVLFITLSTLALLSGCFIDDGDFFDCERGKGPTVTEVLNLNDFHSINLEINANVTIRQGSEQRVEVKGEENIIDLLERRVRNGVWEIDFEDCVRNYDKLHIFITLPEFRRIEIDGSGNVFGENVIRGNAIDLIVDGSGDIDLALDVNAVDASIDGSGDIHLEGEADDVDIFIKGSGNIKAFDLDALRADVRIDGSGDVEVFVRDFLKVSINGSGNVYFKGNPSISTRINGSGDVIDAN